MAEAVAEVLSDGGVLLAEAGTGTGKTLAYLVPAILSRTRVLISTGTKNLQEQIYYKDLPQLRDALRVPFSATYMKGRSNYLCLHRFETFKTQKPQTSINVVNLKILKTWAQETQNGDRAELEELSEHIDFWEEISATSENCLGTECPSYDNCFITRMRQRAAESDLVIVNHHLLCADAAVRQDAYGEVIPACSFAIIDEAHQLEDVATQYFGIHISNYRLEKLLRDGEKFINSETTIEPNEAEELRSDLLKISERSRSFFSKILIEKANRNLGDERTRVTATMQQNVIDEGNNLMGSLTKVEGAVTLLKHPSEDLLSLGRRAKEIKDQLHFLLQADDPSYVYYLEIHQRSVFLKASPIDVSSIVKELLLDRMRGTVLTSATLSIAGSFEHICGRLGIQDSKQLSLPSEFNYAEQTMLYLPRTMPEPRLKSFGAAAGQEVVKLIRSTKGRAFVLFTSYATLRQVQEIVERELDYPVFVQGSAPRSALLRRFRNTPCAILLGTSSFWQGVDVIGEALSCVIIDKLPFTSPSDPITAARIELIKSLGGNPFSEYQVPLAILTLLQGLGRLIRHKSDRGVLAILDPRLRTKGYGHSFMSALPPAPVTSDLAEVERFMNV